jgi:hypothetical protein
MNRVVAPARPATQAGEIDSMESFPGLLKSLKIRAPGQYFLMLLGFVKKYARQPFSVFPLNLYCYTPSVQCDWIFGSAWISNTGYLQIGLPDLFPVPFQSILHFFMLRQIFESYFLKSQCQPLSCHEFISGVSLPDLCKSMIFHKFFLVWFLFSGFWYKLKQRYELNILRWGLS